MLRRFAVLIPVVAAVIGLVAPAAARADSWGNGMNFGVPSQVILGQSFTGSFDMLIFADPPMTAELSGIVVDPVCTTSNAYCGGGTIQDVATVSPTASGVGSAGTTGCTGTWTLTEGSPGSYSLSPPSSPTTVPAGGHCAVSIGLTMDQFPTVDVGGNLGAGVGSYFNATFTTTFPPPAGSSLLGGGTFYSVFLDRPTVAATASNAIIGQPISDTATITNGGGATGTLAFKAYAPNDFNCTGTPLYANSVAVSGNGTYNSGPVTPEVVGPYRWTANYSGDNDSAPVSHACNEPGQTSFVKPDNAFTVGATTNNAKKGTATIKLVLPNPGNLTASGNGVTAASAGRAMISKSVATGPARLTIKAQGKKRRKLNQNGKVTLTVGITYTPTGGDPATKSVKVKLKKKL